MFPLPEKMVLQCISSLFMKISWCLPSGEWGWGVKHYKGCFVWKKIYISMKTCRSQPGCQEIAALRLTHGVTLSLVLHTIALSHAYSHAGNPEVISTWPRELVFPKTSTVSTLLTSPFTELLSHFTRRQQSLPIPAATTDNFSHRICSKVKRRVLAYFFLLLIILF